MKPIKFRVWDKENNEMAEVVEILFDQYGGIDVRTSRRMGINEYALGPNSLIQFTGLLDKNGKEIYEGDIVKYTRKHWYCPGHPEHNKDLVDICTVYWDEEKHGFGKDSMSTRDKTLRVYSSGYLGFNDERADKNIVEVIGNIYENPDILDEKASRPTETGSKTDITYKP
jgi:uncharacterized phage protein (TIGR01671 family)